MDVLRQWPPITRFLVVASLSMSVLAHTSLIPIYWIPYFKQAIYTFNTFPQIWRILTAFLLTSPQLGIVMDPYLIYQYSHSLETESPRFSEIGSYFIYLVFNAAVILALAGHYFGGVIFMSPLILALAFTYSQDNPDRQVSFFVVNFPGKYLPYALILLNLVMSGPEAAKMQGCGLISAHLYDFLTRIWPEFGGGRNYIRVPDFIKRSFGGEPGTRPAPQTRGYGTSFGAAAPQRPPASGSATGANWSNQRGPGRRLGGE